MEQIIVTRRDGTTYPLAVKSQAVSIKEARQSVGLLGDDVVNITVESLYPQHYEIGDRFSVFGRTYKLNQLPRVRKGGAHRFTYELTFEGVQYDLLRAFYDVTIETTGNTLQDVQGDALTGDLKRFATVLVSNANRVFPGKWELGNCPDTAADKTLTFGDGDNCLAVFQNLCKSFEVEADITQSNGIHTINFYTRVGQTHPYVFEFGKGKGLYALDRQNVDSSNVVTRLKVYGSSENITNKYRANRLCLPGKSKAQSFIEQEEAVQKYGIHEARKIFEDIKPTFNGKVTAIVDGNVTQFKDESMFDLNAKEADGKTTKYLVAGVNAKIHFNTGKLAGYEFEINASKGGYDHATHTFTLKPIKNEVIGYVFPDAEHPEFQIAIGDEYKILDITLPEQYQTEAEHKLQEQGNEYYRQNSQPKVKYGLSVSPSFIYKMFGTDVTGTLFAPGDYIQIKDDEIRVDKAIRIQSLQRSLLDVYDYSLTISDSAENNITTRVISELIDIDKIVTTNNLKDPVRAKANWRTTREVLDMVFDPDGDYYTDKIKPSSIDTLALSVGAKSMQFALQDVVFEPNYQGNKNTVRVSAGTLTHYAIEEQVRTWMLPSITIDLYNDAQAYYIYAKCSRENNSGTILFSIDQIKVDQGPNDYHFWIGVINSVDPTLQARIVSLTYGATTVNGKFIRTGRINSSDGLCFFDLDGNRFRVGDNAHGLSWNETGDGRLLLKGTLVQSLGGETSEIGVYRGPWSSSATYYKGDEVSYTSDGETCTYRYINDTPMSNKRPASNANYWSVVAKGKDGKDGENAPAPRIENGYWYIGTQSTGVKAQGKDGSNGEAPRISPDGYWEVYQNGVWTNTSIKAAGADGPGQEFIFLGKSTEQAPSNPTPSNYATNSSYQQDDYRQDPWKDDPPILNNTTTRFIFACERKKTDGRWGRFSDPTLWARYSKDGENGQNGKDGAGVIVVYKNSDTKPAKPTQTESEKKTQTIPNGWKAEAMLENASSGIDNVRYTGAWIEEDGGYKSNAIGHNQLTVQRLTFNAQAAAKLAIALVVSSEKNYDVLAISHVNQSISSANDYNNESKIKLKISGDEADLVVYDLPQSVTDAFIDIAYKKDSSGSNGSDTAHFKLILQPDNAVWWQSSARQEFAADGSWAMSDWSEPVKISGDQGIPGAPGADGRTSYLHIAYANTSSGGGFSQDPAGKKYIGTYTDFVQTDSSDPSRYKWALIKGEDGEKGEKGDSPVCVYRGEYKSGTIYFGTSLRRDVVKHNATYYIAKPNAGTFSYATPSGSSMFWENFGAQFSSVATELLLAENASIGDWFLSGGKIVSTLNDNSDKGKITLDANASKISIQANKVVEGFSDNSYEEYADSNGRIRGYFDLDAANAMASFKMQRNNISGANSPQVVISPFGVRCDFPGLVMPLTGSYQTYSAFRANTKTNVSLSTTGDRQIEKQFATGFYGKVHNLGAAPAYGGYFDNLKAAGLCLSTIVWDDNVANGRIRDDVAYVIVKRTGGGNVQIGLPDSKDRLGKTIFIKNIGSRTALIQPWDGERVYSIDGQNLDAHNISSGSAVMYIYTRLRAGYTSQYDKAWVVIRF